MEEIETTCIRFLNDFKEKANKTDQLPVQMAGYDLLRSELIGEIVEWCHQYLNEKQCPPILLTHFIKRTMARMEDLITTDPASCGYDQFAEVFRPLRLMQKTISVLIDVCLETLENDKMMEFLKTVSCEYKHPKYAVSALKNTRKKMEDKHICISDFNTLFSLDDEEPTSFYAVFDGHGGVDAAAYSVAHFHHFLATNVKYPKKIDEALREAFGDVDRFYSEKSVKQTLNSGTTALCAVYRQKERKLYVGWVGDSQALLVRKGKLWQIVERHSPNSKLERTRIETMGGVVINYAGTWRVNGQLAVSRAIGPHSYKPYISCEPDIFSVELDGDEDFLVMASDGLFDHVSEDEIAYRVYNQIEQDPEALSAVSNNLIQVAKKNGSQDNITVLVVFLKDPKDIVQPTFNNEAGAVEDEPKKTETAQSNNVEEEINLTDVHTTDSLENRILTELRSKYEPVPENIVSETPETPSETEKMDVEKACELTGTEQAVGDSGCEESEDEWDFIKIDKEPGSSKEQSKEKNITNPFAEENFASEAASNVVASGMSSEVMDNIFTSNSGALSADDSLTKGDIMEQNAPTFDDDQPNNLANNHKLQNLIDNLASEPENKNHIEDEDDLQSDLSMLNPTAKEFVPSFGQAPVLSPTAASNGQANLFLFDDVVAQSPRKPTPMENIDLPSETEFDQDISGRPHELEAVNDFILSHANGNGGGVDALNPKELAQGDEKSEDDYLAEPKPLEEAEPLANVLPIDRFDQPEAMQESFYEEKATEELNKVQVLPLEENGNAGDLLESPDNRQIFGLNPFEATLEEIHEDFDKDLSQPLYGATANVTSKFSAFLTEARKVEDFLLGITDEVEPKPVQEPVIPESSEPMSLDAVSTANQYDELCNQFEKAMNEENQKHLERITPEVELLAPESSVDEHSISPSVESVQSEPVIEHELIKQDEASQDVLEMSQPIEVEDSFVDLRSPEPVQEVIEEVEQFVVSPEPSPALITIPETPVIEEQPIVEEKEPEPVIEAVCEPEAVIVAEPVVEPVTEPEPVIEAEPIDEPEIEQPQSIIEVQAEPAPIIESQPEPEPEPIVMSEPIIESQPEPVVERVPTPEPVVVELKPIEPVVTAVTETLTTQLIESIPDVIPKAEAAKQQEEEKKKTETKITAAKKTTATKTAASPRPKTTSAITSKTATTTSRPASARPTATKLSPTTATTAKRSVPSAVAAPKAAAPKPAATRTLTAPKPTPARPATTTSRVTATRVTSATKVSPTTDKAAGDAKPKTAAPAKPRMSTTTTSRPASSTLASRKPLTTTARTASSAKSPDDKSAPAKPAFSASTKTSSLASRTTTASTTAARKPAPTGIAAARAAAAGRVGTLKSSGAAKPTTLKPSTTTSTKKPVTKPATAIGAKPAENLVENGTATAVANGTTNGHD